jgi:hypothetical protein
MTRSNFLDESLWFSKGFEDMLFDTFIILGTYGCSLLGDIGLSLYFGYGRTSLSISSLSGTMIVFRRSEADSKE